MPRLYISISLYTSEVFSCPPSHVGALGAAFTLGMVHAWVGHSVLKCNDFKTLLSNWR